MKKVLLKMKKQNIVRGLAAGSVVATASAQAAVPAVLTSAISTFQTDAQTMLDQGMGVAIGITAVFVIWSLAKRVFKKSGA